MSSKSEERGARRVQIRDYQAADFEGQVLPMDTIIRFTVGDWDYQWIDVKLEGDRLTIRAGHQLDIQPEVTNCINVGVPQ